MRVTSWCGTQRRDTCPGYSLRVIRLGCVSTVCYDGRGAIAAEWKEYHVAHFKNIQRSIRQLESNAVRQSDFRIAVSSKLVSYWEKEFDYASSDHVIIPCTLNSRFALNLLPENEITGLRAGLEFKPEDIVFIYSGSVSGWQSFELVTSFMLPLLKNQPSTRLIFLSGINQHIEKLIREYPGQVSRRWVPHHEVTRMLAAADYGLLLRDRKMTNFVAAPTKFAEYLSAGLQVIISKEIGDYTEFVKKWGVVLWWIMTGRLSQ